jgi:hypothetical protein
MFGIGALSFASPLILGALLALPAIWLLLRATPPQPRQVTFPAFRILRQLKSKEETPDRTPWWLMALRLLLSAFLILGLAGPVLNAPKPSSMTGPLVIVLDDTFAAAPGWKDRERALRTATETAAQSGRSLFFVTTALSPPKDALAPLAGEEALSVVQSIRPQPFLADRKAAKSGLVRLDAALKGARAEIRWLADGVSTDGDEALAEALNQRGHLSIYIDAERPHFVLRPEKTSAGAPLALAVQRLDGSAVWRGEVVAAARDGREIGRASVEMAPGKSTATATIDLPLALRNEVATASIDGEASAGAVWLADARDRKALIGLVAGADNAGDALLSGSHYVRKALEPYAAFIADTLQSLLASDASVIVLDDVGRLRPEDAAALEVWIEKGGVVIRFAGPNLAEAAQDADPPLLPTSLRGGGRAFGGALTWETPQAIGAFSDAGPFVGLSAPKDVVVRRQVLARPGGDTTERSWATLTDGTPIVTGRRIGDGALALFHVPATPGWSDLPLSNVFVEMLRKLTYLSALGPKAGDGAQAARLAPLRLLDGFGRFERPRAEALPIVAAEAELGPAPDRPPGFYGAPEAPLAVNALPRDFLFAPLNTGAATVRSYADAAPVRLAPSLLTAALLLLMLDALATLFLAGRLTPRFAALVLIGLAPLAPKAEAKPLDAPIAAETEAAALATRLAYVRTGDPDVDRLSQAGLAALSRELFLRTSLEPQTPAAIDLETDDLSVYPLLYWPIVPGASASGAALANVETFMRFGGLVIFDTRDDERAITGGETPERATLKEILSQIDVPPLATLSKDHVLTRSFYLLADLPGRMRDNPVWVQASGDANDGVTPLIIGGRDWAGAWAADSFGRPMRPMTQGGERARELAYRAGINIVMVAYTGNYKSDQVHTPILLERLGR